MPNQQKSRSWKPSNYRLPAFQLILKNNLNHGYFSHLVQNSLHALTTMIFFSLFVCMTLYLFVSSDTKNLLRLGGYLYCTKQNIITSTATCNLPQEFSFYQPLIINSLVKSTPVILTIIIIINWLYTVKVLNKRICFKYFNDNVI